jgi:hypothetical protein
MLAYGKPLKKQRWQQQQQQQQPQSLNEDAVIWQTAQHATNDS